MGVKIINHTQILLTLLSHLACCPFELSLEQKHLKWTNLVTYLICLSSGSIPFLQKVSNNRLKEETNISEMPIRKTIRFSHELKLWDIYSRHCFCVHHVPLIFSPEFKENPWKLSLLLENLWESNTQLQHNYNIAQVQRYERIPKLAWLSEAVQLP